MKIPKNADPVTNQLTAERERGLGIEFSLTQDDLRENDTCLKRFGWSARR